MTRTVIDTDVMVAAIRSEFGASRLVLESALHGRYPVVVSIPLMIEYEATMARPEHLAASGLTRAELDALLDVLASIAKPVRLDYLWRAVLRDPNDDMVLETAVNGGARRIVTFNVKDFRGIASRFGIDVIVPGTMLRELENER